MWDIVPFVARVLGLHLSYIVNDYLSKPQTHPQTVLLTYTLLHWKAVFCMPSMTVMVIYSLIDDVPSVTSALYNSPAGDPSVQQYVFLTGEPSVQKCVLNSYAKFFYFTGLVVAVLLNF